MAWIFFLASGASQKPSKDTSGQLPIVKATDTLREFFCPVCVKDHYQLPLSGTMYELCMVPCSQCGPKSSTADSPVRTSALQDMEKAWRESVAAYFSRLSASSKQSDQLSFSLKMSPQSEQEVEKKSSKNFPAYGMTVDGECYPLTMWARRTREKDGGYLPTPTRNDYKHPGLPRRGTNSCSAHSLAAKVMWPTPTVQDAENNGGGSQYSRNSIPLNALVKISPTPVASGKLNGGTRDFQKLKELRDGGQITEAERRSMSQGNGGKLNPRWVAWLMGYPTEWTSLGPWVIAWFRPRREKRSKG